MVSSKLIKSAVGFESCSLIIFEVLYPVTSPRSAPCVEPLSSTSEGFDSTGTKPLSILCVCEPLPYFCVTTFPFSTLLLSPPGELSLSAAVAAKNAKLYCKSKSSISLFSPV